MCLLKHYSYYKNSIELEMNDCVSFTPQNDDVTPWGRDKSMCCLSSMTSLVHNAHIKTPFWSITCTTRTWCGNRAEVSFFFLNKGLNTFQNACAFPTFIKVFRTLFT